MTRCYFTAEKALGVCCVSKESWDGVFFDQGTSWVFADWPVSFDNSRSTTWMMLVEKA